MIVMKFGGTSVEDATSIERVAEIIRARLELKPIVVVSAMGKTTRKLLQASESSASGDSRTTLATIADLKTRHTSEARRLVKSASEQKVLPLIEKYFDEMKKLLEGLAILGEVPPRGLDKILSYGELLSSVIVAGALEDRGLRARLLDSRDFIKTDDRYGGASPLFDLTNRRVRETIPQALEDGEVPVIQGFIASTREGATTTLGFEGSDYTAAIVGAALEADDIQIWKDVSGMMTADPAIFSGARTVKSCTFREAAELTYFGAKVLHPKAIHPASQKNIPVHIYNSKQPEATGTAISATAPRSRTLIKSIAYKQPVTIVTAIALQGVRGDAVDFEDFQRVVLASLRGRNLSPLFAALSASSVALALDSSALAGGKERDFLEDLSRFSTLQVEADKSIITLVGEDLKSDATALRQIFEALTDTRIGIILHGSSPITINLVIESSDTQSAIARLHEVFFRNPDPEIFE